MPMSCGFSSNACSSALAAGKVSRSALSTMNLGMEGTVSELLERKEEERTRSH